MHKKDYSLKWRRIDWMTFELSKYLQEINEDVEEEADKLRSIPKWGIRGIKDIFKFIDQTLGYLLIRYPLGEESLKGFATVHTGERLIVTNFSQRLWVSLLRCIIVSKRVGRGLSHYGLCGLWPFLVFKTYLFIIR